MRISQAQAVLRSLSNNCDQDSEGVVRRSAAQIHDKDRIIPPRQRKLFTYRRFMTYGMS